MKNVKFGILREQALRLAPFAWVVIILCGPAIARNTKRPVSQATPVSALDRLLTGTESGSPTSPTVGSLYTPDGSLADIAMDFRATRVGDVVTVIVAEQASANSQGTTSTKRTSSANASVSSLLGPKVATGALANLANLSGQQQLQGQGATSRITTLTTTLSARVLKVLPNGNLIVEGTKAVAINSEVQNVSLRGIVRPIDIGPDNSITSSRVADLEVRINGRGVVNDAIHRPNFLYRLLLGVLPF
jgi:flagellar L-ring protein precursor FlgH